MNENWKVWGLWALIMAGLLITVNPYKVDAQIAGHGDSGQDCAQETLIGLLGVTSAGNIEACMYYPRTVPTATDIFFVSGILTAPAATGAGTATATWTIINLGGCTNGAPQTGGAGGTGFGTQFDFVAAWTMGGQHCSVRVEVVYKNGAGTTLFDHNFVWTVMAYNTFQRLENHVCSNVLTSCAIPTMGELVFNCGANGGTIAAGFTGSQCLNPQIDNENRLCAASNYGTACTDPNFRAFQCAASTANPLTAASCKTTYVAGFWELFAPTIFVLALLVILPTAKIWLVPVGVAFGGMVGIMAFTQTSTILIVMQAASGFALMSFSLYWLGLRFQEFKTKERKWFQ